MPYVSVKITREASTTSEAKAELIRRITVALAEVLGKDPDTTFVVIDEVDMADWGVGGVPVQAWRAARHRGIPGRAPA